MTDSGRSRADESPRPTPSRRVFDGAFIGPMLPPPSPPAAALPGPAWWPPAGGFAAIAPLVPAPPPPTDATLAIPLDARGLVKEALDLLTRSDSGLRGPSFYVGFMMLASVAPVVILLALLVIVQGDALFGFGPVSGSGDGAGREQLAWLGWLGLAAVPGMFGYLAATVDARALATAVIGARAEGRPLRLAASIAVARRRFWPVLGAQLLIGFITGLVTTIAAFAVLVAFGPVEPISYGVQLVLGLVIGTPVVYVPAAIVLGGTGIFESIRRSFGLANTRRRLAVVVTLFGLVSQLVVMFGLSVGLDTIARFIIGTGLTDRFPPPLVVPLGAAFVFALGTLVFLVEVIAAAPPVFAFIALTHYTWGLEAGRQDPVRVGHLWDPWVTPGLALVAGLALIALVGGVVSLSG